MPPLCQKKDSKSPIGTKSYPAVLLLPDHFFASTPLLLPSPLLYYPLLCLSNIPTVVPLPARLLAALLTIFFLVASATEPPILPNSFLKIRRCVLHFRHFVYKCITDCSLSLCTTNILQTLLPLFALERFLLRHIQF